VSSADRLLVVEDVTKVFRQGPQEVPVLRGVSMDLRPNEIVVLEGPSGSGKTTLLSVLGCILTASTGRVTVRGQVVSPEPGTLEAIRRRHIGFVFQECHLFPALSARENVEYALGIKGLRGRAGRDEAVRVLEAVGMGDRLNFLPRDLSGGQKQRVAIARAVAGAPEIILADEPTANLDTQTGLQVLDVFRYLAKESGKGVVLVTHDPKVRAVADRVLSIRDGRLSQEHAVRPAAAIADRREGSTDEAFQWVRA
jgi:putative ABC transport system ATP-binding protein